MLTLTPLTYAQDDPQYTEREAGVHIVDGANVLSNADVSSVEADLQTLLDETGVDVRHGMGPFVAQDVVEAHVVTGEVVSQLGQRHSRDGDSAGLPGVPSVGSHRPGDEPDDDFVEGLGPEPEAIHLVGDLPVGLLQARQGDDVPGEGLRRALGVGHGRTLWLCQMPGGMQAPAGRSAVSGLWAQLTAASRLPPICPKRERTSRALLPASCTAFSRRRSRPSVRLVIAWPSLR